MLVRFAFVEYEDPRDADDAFHDMHNRRIGRDVFVVEVHSLLPGDLSFFSNVCSGQRTLPLLLGVLREAVIGLSVTLIVAMTVIVIGIIPVVTLPVVVLQEENVVHAAGILLPLAEIEMTEMGDEGGASVDPPRAPPPDEVTGTRREAVVQGPTTGEEIAIAMTGTTETTETICEMFDTMAKILVRSLTRDF